MGTFQKLLESNMTATVESLLQASGLETLNTIAIPHTSHLLAFDPDYFPSYFRGWCAATGLDVQVLEVQDVGLPTAAYDTPHLVASLPRASFAVMGCAFDILEDFCKKYEARLAIGSGDADELIVLRISLEPGSDAPQLGMAH